MMEEREMNGGREMKKLITLEVIVTICVLTAYFGMLNSLASNLASSSNFVITWGFFVISIIACAGLNIIYLEGDLGALVVPAVLMAVSVAAVTFFCTAEVIPAAANTIVDKICFIGIIICTVITDILGVLWCIMHIGNDDILKRVSNGKLPKYSLVVEEIVIFAAVMIGSCFVPFY